MPKIKTTTTCKLWFCHDDEYANGLCMRHYRNAQRHSGGVHLGSDERNLLAQVQRTNIFLTRITEQCFIQTQGVCYCRYCGAENTHDENCEVLTAQCLLENTTSDTRGRLRG